MLISLRQHSTGPFYVIFVDGNTVKAVRADSPHTAYEVDAKLPIMQDDYLPEAWRNVVLRRVMSLFSTETCNVVTFDHEQAKLIWEVESGNTPVRDGWDALMTTLK